MQEIKVNLGKRSYPICIGFETFDQLPKKINEMFQDSQFAVITNTTIREKYTEQIETLINSLDAVVHAIPDGEKYKNTQTWNGILDVLLENRFERSSVVIALGGGVVGDITGFAAAVFLRGVKYVQIPTTLLAMVDSSVGGKTAVNHSMGKNLIGAFHQPSLVWVDTKYLNTLPEREFIAGYAELYKYGFIGGRDMFDFVTQNHDAMINKEDKVIQEGIRRSIAIKAKIVSEDERESGKRALLNFGHTFAHTLENFFNYENILHGEAVLWGIACACDLGKRIASVPQESGSAYDSILKKLILPELPGKPIADKLYTGMLSDKKVINGKIRFVLPTNPGTSVIKSDVTQEPVMESLKQVFGE